MDDLVAALTLRLNNEMGGGIDEIDAEFGVLDSTLQGLRDVLGELTTVLNDLKAPVALSDGMSAVADRASDATAAVSAIGDAIDADAAKLRALQSLWLDGAGTFLPPTGDNDPTRPAFVPPGYLPPAPPEPGEPDPRPAPERQHGTGGDLVSTGLFAVLGLASGRDAADDYAKFVNMVTQTAIKEGLNGERAKEFEDQLGQALSGLALDTGTSSQELAEAYFFLVTTGMNKALINQLMPALAQDATAYHLAPMDEAQSVFTLQGVMGIAPDQMQQALSMLSMAAQLGHFSVGDFGHYLPGFASQMALLKDTGLSGEAQIAAALEANRRTTGTSEEDDRDLEDLVSYIASPIAGRFFDRTKRSEDLLGRDTRATFEKYHLQNIDIPKYLDDKEASGEGTFDAMMDLAHYIQARLPKDITGSDAEVIFKALFHNKQAADAAMGIAQNYDVFKDDERILGGVTAGKVQTDFQTAFNSPAGQLGEADEKFAQLSRTLGQDMIPTLLTLGTAADWFAKGLNVIGDAFTHFVAGPLGAAMGSTAAEVLHAVKSGRTSYIGSDDGLGEIGKWLGIHVTTDPGTTATVTKAPPGTSVKVNQGQVLGAP